MPVYGGDLHNLDPELYYYDILSGIYVPMFDMVRRGVVDLIFLSPRIQTEGIVNIPRILKKIEPHIEGKKGFINTYPIDPLSDFARCVALYLESELAVERALVHQNFAYSPNVSQEARVYDRLLRGGKFFEVYEKIYPKRMEEFVGWADVWMVLERPAIEYFTIYSPLIDEKTRMRIIREIQRFEKATSDWRRLFQEKVSAKKLMNYWFAIPTNFEAMFLGYNSDFWKIIALSALSCNEELMDRLARDYGIKQLIQKAYRSGKKVILERDGRYPMRLVIDPGDSEPYEWWHGIGRSVLTGQPYDVLLANSPGAEISIEGDIISVSGRVHCPYNSFIRQGSLIGNVLKEPVFDIERGVLKETSLGKPSDISLDGFKVVEVGIGIPGVLVYPYGTNILSFHDILEILRFSEDNGDITPRDRFRLACKQFLSQYLHFLHPTRYPLSLMTVFDDSSSSIINGQIFPNIHLGLVGPDGQHLDIMVGPATRYYVSD